MAYDVPRAVAQYRRYAVAMLEATQNDIDPNETNDQQPKLGVVPSTAISTFVMNYLDRRASDIFNAYETDLEIARMHAAGEFRAFLTQQRRSQRQQLVRERGA